MTNRESRKDEDTTIKVASSKTMTSGSKAMNNGVIKLKKSVPKHNKPGNWMDGSIFDGDDRKAKPSAITAASPGPLVNPLDDDARENFATGRPLEDVPDLQHCKHCKKSILLSKAKEHIAACLRIKKEKAQRKKEAREARERAREAAREEEARKENEENGGGDDDSDDGEDKKAGNAGKTTKKASKKLDGATGGKKRKAETDLNKANPKKKKDEPKGKTAKAKGPVDVERQCGVILPNGQPCARSLTCKSHSMGAKRAVPGRSLPYDFLLAAYQKKNQAKQQKAALDATAPLEDEDDGNADAVDSDEETAAVMNALGKWKPQPVVPQPVFAPIKRQYQLARLHEQLQTATNGGRLNIFKVHGYGAQKLPDGHTDPYHEMDDAPGEPDTNMMDAFSRRSSSFGLAGPPIQRRPSIAGRA